MSRPLGVLSMDSRYRQVEADILNLSEAPGDEGYLKWELGSGFQEKWVPMHGLDAREKLRFDVWGSRPKGSVLATEIGSYGQECRFGWRRDQGKIGSRTMDYAGREGKEPVTASTTAGLFWIPLWVPSRRVGQCCQQCWRGDKCSRQHEEQRLLEWGEWQSLRNMDAAKERHERSKKEGGGLHKVDRTILLKMLQGSPRTPCF